MLDAHALLQLLHDHGHDARPMAAPPGSDWLVFDCGVLVRSAGSEIWHWSVVASGQTRAGEGELATAAECVQLLRHLQAGGAVRR